MTLLKIKSVGKRQRQPAHGGLLVCVFLLAWVLAESSLAQTSKEYFVRQEANEALVIRIDALEAEIKASVYAPEHRLILSSALPASRLVPVFQFISSTSTPRQLDIAVSASHSTANSEFDIAFTRLSAWDDRSAALLRAYSLLSFGMQQANSGSAADWTVKINSLMSAGGTFDKYGMQELRLWSAYLATHLVQYRLHDYNMVLGLTREILEATRGSRWQDIELAALQLRGAALIGLRKAGELRVSAADPDPVQTALERAEERADAMGYAYEKASAIRQSALEYQDLSLISRALEQFQRALKIAGSIGDESLATEIRESIVRIYAGQGDDTATNKVLQEIEPQLVAGGGGDELALNLLQQGRIFIRSYRYPQAIEVLQQALSFENDSSIRTRINKALARAYFETGQDRDSQAVLEATGISRPQAAGYFLQEYRATLANPLSVRYSMEAKYLQARSLATRGQLRQALDVLRGLIDEVLFLRKSIPGVLGAWYWQRHEQLLGDYLAWQMPGSNQSTAGGLESLLVLSKMRHSELPGGISVDTDALRNILAQREGDTGITGSSDPSAVEHQMDALRPAFKAEYKFLSRGNLAGYLQNLASDEALLTYHVTRSAAYVWLGRHGKVRQHRISRPQQLHAALLKAGTRAGRLPASLGEQLLGPVAGDLAKTVYMVPAGLFLNFPMDALQWRGSYLVKRHTVVNLLSFPANRTPRESLRFTAPREVFLAGNPQDFSASYATRLETTAEIGAVTELFRGPGLHIIQGAALLPDEFKTARFANANLVHLSMPSTTDLAYPQRSMLELSEAFHELGRTPFRLADIRSLKIKTGLVLVSSAQAVGQAHNNISQQAGLASAFLEAGAGAVVASLWTTSEGISDGLVKDFYGELARSQDIAAAMVAAKRNFLLMNRGKAPADWARYQIFIR